MKSLILVLVATFFLQLPAFSQVLDYTSIKRNHVFLEGFLVRHDFSSGFVSINYERALFKKRKSLLRLGIYPDFESTVSFPLTFSRLTHPLGNHHFEYGFGAIFRIEHFVDPQGINTREWFYDLPGLLFPLMYRYQNKEGWFFRGGINLIVSWPTLPSPSLGLGYKF